MRFIPLARESEGAAGPDAAAVRDWSAEYRAGRRIGALSLGTDALFFRKALTVYVVPYAQIRRYFRRVLAIPARIGCCAGGELRVENLVVCVSDASGAEREAAQIQLPGERAAKIVMEELRRLAPDAASGKPETPKGANP